MPKVEYRDNNGNLLPGVTTIIQQNLGWNRGALMGWAYAQGKAGLPLRDQKSLDIGTLAHSWIEADIKQKHFEWPAINDEMRAGVENAILGYLEWKDLVSFQLINSELSLVSKRGYGGTIDIVGSVRNQPAIIDIKTSDAVYIDHKIQVAAYKNLYNENFPQPITMVYILQISKKDGGFAYHYFPNLEAEWHVFLLLLELEKYRNQLK